MQDLFPLRWLRQLLAWHLTAKWNPATLLVTMFTLGFDKIAPGTLGSLATTAIWGLYYRRLFHWSGYSLVTFTMVYLVLLLATYWLAYESIQIYLTKSTSEDPKEVIIDEYIGQTIALVMAFISYWVMLRHYQLLSLEATSFTRFASLATMLLGFMFFRIFDIWKPSLVGYFDKNWHNAHGILLDDVVAGVFAGISMFGFWSVFLYIFK